MPGGIHADPRAELSVAPVRFRLKVWHVLSGLILFSLACWAGLAFLLDLAAATLHSIGA